MRCLYCSVFFLFLLMTGYSSAANSAPPAITEGASVEVSMSEDANPNAFALTLNAEDPESGVLTWSLDTVAQNGIAAASGTGKSQVVSYTPVANYFGTDTFVVKVTDPDNESASIAVNVTIEAVNDAPIGEVTISGPNQAGSILTSDVSGLTDVDGLGKLNFQWFRDEVAIPGATGPVVALGNDDVGKQMSVLVSYVDGQGTSESVTSAKVGPVADNPGHVQDNLPPVISQGATVSVSMSEDGSPTPFGLTLFAEDPENTALVWSLVFAPIKGEASVEAGAMSNGGSSTGGAIASAIVSYTPEANYSGNDSFVVQVQDSGGLVDTIAVQVTIEEVNDAPSGMPVIRGQMMSGQELTVDVSGVTDADGLGTFGYQWTRGGEAISGATESKYAVKEDDEGAIIGVVVSYVDGRNNTESITVAGSSTVTVANKTPVIKEGEQIAVVMSEDGAPTPFSLVLNATDSEGEILVWTISQAAKQGVARANVAGISASIGYVPEADFNGNDSFEVRVTDSQGAHDAITVNVSVEAVNDSPSGKITITGEPSFEGVLTADTVSISDPDGRGTLQTGASQMQWFRNNEPIEFATVSQYIVTKADIGQSLMAQVRFIDGGGTTETVVSDPVTPGPGALDVVAPEIPPLATITAPSTGLLTPVLVPGVYAVDDVDGEIAASVSQGGPFAPGSHTLIWTATDQSGNQASARQSVNILPQANFAIDQKAEEGSRVQVSVQLNGNAPGYPVHLAYSTGGTATADDHNAVSGVLTIDNGVTGAFSFDLLEDDVTGEHGETIVFRLVSADNAVIGQNSTHTVTVAEHNEPPRVALNSEQQGASRNLVVAGDGPVTIVATVTDVNAADTHTFDWSASDEQLLGMTGPAEDEGSTSPDPNDSSASDGSSASDASSASPGSKTRASGRTGKSTTAKDGQQTEGQTGEQAGEQREQTPGNTGNTLTIDPSKLPPGVYQAVLTVMDSGEQNLSASETTLIQVLSEAPVLSADVDTDLDGLSDLAEGITDSDGDRIPDYADAISASNLMQTSSHHQGSYLLETNPGLALTLGKLAFSLSKRAAGLDTDTVAREAAVEVPRDPGVRHVSGLYDYEVHKLAEPGDVVDVVIPLDAAIPDDARFRQLMFDGWQTFIENGSNTLASSPGSSGGACPSAGDASYEDGLTAGHKCVWKRIEDGGANDADGEANRKIIDRGVIVGPDTSPGSGRGGNTNRLESGGGAFGYGWLAFLALCMLLKFPTGQTISSLP